MLALANAIFELLYPNLKTQAVFTVPTRALALDKHSNRFAVGTAALTEKHLCASIVTSFVRKSGTTARRERFTIRQKPPAMNVQGKFVSTWESGDL